MSAAAKLGPEQRLALVAKLERDQAAAGLSDPDWPDAPVPFGGAKPPAFPSYVLPAELERFVTGVAEATQTPPDLAGLIGLGVLASTVQGRVVVEVSPGWQEPTSLYLMAVAPSGERKSAVVAECRRPLDAVFKAEGDAVSPARERALINREVLQASLVESKKRAAKLKDSTERLAEIENAVRLQDQIAELEIPHAGQRIFDDVTLEALAVGMKEQGDRGEVFSAEASIMGVAAGRYSDSAGPNIDLLLKAHAGEPVSVRRIGRPAIDMDHPALTIALLVQPAVARDFVGSANLRSRGLPARFLIAQPTSRVGVRDLQPTPLSYSARDGYADLIRRITEDLSHLSHLSRGPRIVRFSEGAVKAHLAFRKELEPELGPGGDLSRASLADWGSKLPGAVARIAGLFHLAEFGVDEEISEDTTARAIELGYYFLAQALHVGTELSLDPQVESARAVLSWCRRPDVRDRGFTTTREIQRAFRTRFKTVDLVSNVQDLLVERGWFKRSQIPRANGCGTMPILRIHPLLWDGDPGTSVTSVTSREPGSDG